MALDDLLQDAADLPNDRGVDADADNGSPSRSEEPADPSEEPKGLSEELAKLSDQPRETPPGPPALCDNCQTPLLGAFCHQCGQSDRPLDLSLGAFAREWLGSVFGFDGRVWRTLALMLRRPGHLSHDYLQGRRARYVSPLRLYFFISLAAFLLLTAADRSLVNVSDGDADDADLSLSVETPDLDDHLAEALEGGPEPDAVPEDGVPQDGVSPEELEAVPDASSAQGVEDPGSPDKAEEVTSSESGTDSLETAADDFEAATEGFVDRAIETVTGNRDQFSKEFARNLPKAVFFLVPFYAVLLKLFFRRRYRSFLQHLVVSLHLHTTAFVLITLGSVIDLALSAGKPNSEPGSSLAALILIVHTFMTLRHVYGDRRLVLLVKYAFLSLAHLSALGLVMLANLFFALYQMGVFE